MGADEEAGEDVAGCGAAGVFEVGGAAGKGGIVDLLDTVPGGAVDDGLAVVGDDVATVVQLADVDGVGEEVAPGVFAVVEADGVGDGIIGGAVGAHAEGLLDEGCEGGVGYPAVDDVGLAIAALAKVDGLATDEAAGGDAGDGAVLLEVVVEAAAYIGGEGLEVAGVGPVDEGFEEAAVEAGGDVILYGLEGVAMTAQEGFVVLGVVEFAGEAGELPEEDVCGRAGGGGEVGDELEEGVTADDAGAGLGFVDVDLVEDEALLGGVDADDGFLLGDGEILIVATAVAEVGNGGV